LNAEDHPAERAARREFSHAPRDDHPPSIARKRRARSRRWKCALQVPASLSALVEQFHAEFAAIQQIQAPNQQSLGVPLLPRGSGLPSLSASKRRSADPCGFTSG
jgi:hypothetical protein